MMIDYLLSEYGFNLTQPKMLLCVTGAEEKLLIDDKTSTAFKLGLMKAAKTTNAWITSAGTNSGVMRLVGDAVEKDIRAHDLTVLGIAPWGCIACRDDLIV